MNMNLTLLGQAISFAIFVWFCMRYVWPPIIAALEAREAEIADGLASAEKGRHELANACLLYTSPSPRDATLSRMPSSA